jgi:AcrR family transcriptional regulator
VVALVSLMGRPKPRFERESWIELGLSVLKREGFEALTIERLTAVAGKTRGSFYHHFEDHGAFLAALGERWIVDETEGVIAVAEAAVKSGNRRAAMARRAAKVDHALERELRRLGAVEPVIAAVIARSDELRIAYVARLFRSELGLGEGEALARARIQHCVFVGAQMVFPEADEGFRLKLESTLNHTLWRK